MLCPKCNNTLVDGALFCGNCGSAVTPVEEVSAPVAEEMPAVAEQMPQEAIPFAEDGEAVASEETPVAEEAAKPRKPIGWIVTAVLSAVVLVGVGAFFLCRALFAGPLVGTWQVSLKMSDLMSMVTEESLEQAETILGAQYGDMSALDLEKLMKIFDIEEPLSAYVTFDKEEMSVTVNLDELGDAMTVLYDNVLAYIEDGGLYDIYAMQGYSREETDMMLEQSGMDLESMIAMMRLAQSQLKVELANSLKTIATDIDGKNYTLGSFAYTYEDGWLSVDDAAFKLEIEVQGNRIRITDNVLTAMEGGEQLAEFIKIERAELPQ